MSVLDIRDLSIRFDTQQGPIHALRHIDMTVPSAEIVGVVGESGSGKSTLALAIMRLLPDNATVAGGAVDFAGNDLLQLSPEAMRALRGKHLSMVFQDPMTSLNPVRTIGQQLLDIQYRDQDSTRGEKLRRSTAVLTRVGLSDAQSQLGRYPFQFSGGMRQRISIAMSLLQKPQLLIADEVTTALDVTLEAQILHLLRELRQELDASILFISHNLGAVAEICDRVVVLYAGEVVEQGPVREILKRPQHPYTRALIECDPARIGKTTRELPVIPGDVPDLRQVPQGCIFASRCPQAIARCRLARPPAVTVGRRHIARCLLVGEPVA